jgi:hypothetical protein
MSEAVEAIKVALKQEAEGIMVTFRIQPEHFPEHLLVAKINARFALAFQEIDDNEEPKPADPERKTKRKQNANVMRAAIACGETSFQTFMRKEYPAEWAGGLGEGQTRAADAMRAVLKIESRKDLAADMGALARFDTLMGQYEMWKQGK